MNESQRNDKKQAGAELGQAQPEQGLEVGDWSWGSNSKFDVAARSWGLKSKVEVWYFSLKFEIAIWSCSLK